jgi:hypothetical protein
MACICGCALADTIAGELYLLNRQIPNTMRFLCLALFMCAAASMASAICFQGICSQPATATATPSGGYAPLPVSFNATPPMGGAQIAYVFDHWDFGDGTMDTINQATHTYEQAGQFTAGAFWKPRGTNSPSMLASVVVNVSPLTSLTLSPSALSIRGGMRTPR